MDKISFLDHIEQGPPSDTDVNRFLRSTYWKLLGEIAIGERRISALQYMDLLEEFVKIPEYVGKSQAGPNERKTRLNNALRNLRGADDSSNPDMTWKRFIEGLLVLKATSLRITCEVKRGGKFSKTKMVTVECRPRDEHLAMLDGVQPIGSKESTTVALANYLKDPAHTARTIMRHPLLKALWMLFAEFGIDNRVWNKLVTNYVHDEANCVAMKRRRSDKKHNLQSAIVNTELLSWKKFLEALKAIDGRTLNITFRLESALGIPAETSLSINLADIRLWSNKDEPE